MDGLSHEEAVDVLKATPQTVDMKVEKGALVKSSHSPQESNADLQVRCSLWYNYIILTVSLFTNPLYNSTMLKTCITAAGPGQCHILQ